MPDLLGATNPVPGYETNLNNRNTPVTTNTQNPQIQNIPDPTRVNRGDRRTEQQDANLQGDGRVRYDSNFQTFLQRMGEGSGLLEQLSKLFAGREGTVVLSGLSEGTAAEMAQILEMLRMDEGQFKDFLMGQVKAGTRFGGALFALLRGAYAKAGSEGVRTDILQFLKAYADFSSTDHIEGNILRNLRDMADAMPASWADKLRELTAQLKNGVAAGDRQGNLQLLQRDIFPYMSSYVERTHDLGLPRTLLSLLALNVTRYENGSLENLLESFHQLSGYGTLKTQLGAVDDQALLTLLRGNRFDTDSQAVRFADRLLSTAANILRGEGNAEVQQAFQNLISAMLINQSVYMPVNHYLIPLEWDGRLLFSELWVDPDAEQEEQKREGQRGNTFRFLFKMDVQHLGLFDIVLTSRGREVEVQIACPEKVAPFARQIETSISGILERNELTPAHISVRRMERPVTLTEVFPKIFEGKNSVNVKV